MGKARTECCHSAWERSEPAGSSVPVRLVVAVDRFQFNSPNEGMISDGKGLLQHRVRAVCRCCLADNSKLRSLRLGGHRHRCRDGRRQERRCCRQCASGRHIGSAAPAATARLDR
jgi:hypothetical protein